MSRGSIDEEEHELRESAGGRRAGMRLVVFLRVSGRARRIFSCLGLPNDGSRKIIWEVPEKTDQRAESYRDQIWTSTLGIANHDHR